MRKLAINVTACWLILTILIGALPPVFACGPFTVEPLFSFTKHLDYPLASAVAAKPGIVPASYGRISLFVFYRQLNDLTFTAREQQGVADAISRRIGIRASESAAELNNSAQRSPNAPAAEEMTGIAEWRVARTRVASEMPPVPETEKRAADSYYYYDNCLADAFRRATRTLAARIAKFGAENEAVKEWASGQDAVFSNCNGSGDTPEPLDESAPDWLRRDRAYQIAAALFYRNEFPEARRLFERVAADQDSEWKPAAQLVVARTYIREASFINDVESSDAAEKQRAKAELLRKAETRLRDVLADSTAAGFHDSARRLLNLVLYRTAPAEQAKRLAKSLAEAKENPNIGSELIDYIRLLDAVESRAAEKGREYERAQAATRGENYIYDYRLKRRDIDPQELDEDLTDWLLTYHAADGFDHAYAKWRATRNLAWFVAAIAKTDAKAASAAELLDEAAKIKADSPAYATVRYHQIRLLIESGRRAEAKRQLDAIFARPTSRFARSTENKLLAQRTIFAENLDDFLKYAQRRAAVFVWSDDGNEEGDALTNNRELAAWKNRTMFDEDAVAFINEKMPLAVLREAASSRELPEHLKKFFVTAVWTRAFVLREQAVEREFALLMPKYAPEFAPALGKYTAAVNSVDREAGALLLILNNPVIQPYVPVGMGRAASPPASIDSTRGNWWCRETSDDKADKPRYNHYPFDYPTAYPSFLTAAQSAAGAREHREMLASGSSATFLARRAVEFANRHPNHAATPEILHLAVRATRYGCTDEQTKKFSKAAFDFLHKRFPKNRWTLKTPYYFG